MAFTVIIPPLYLGISFMLYEGGITLGNP